MLCSMSLGFYTSASLNRQTLHSFFARSRILITFPRRSFTSNRTIHPSNNISDTINSTLPDRRFAIFACSIHATTLAYSFYAPITAAAWKRVGYETIVVFTGDFTISNALSHRLNLTRAYLKRIGAYIVDVQCNKSYAVKISQLVRVFSGFLPDTIVRDNDDIITGDSDLMPLRISDYQPTNKTDGFIFNAFCCGSFQRRGRSYRMFPSRSKSFYSFNHVYLLLFNRYLLL